MSSRTRAAGMSATPSSLISLASIAEFRGKPYRAIFHLGAIKPQRSVRSRFLRGTTFFEGIVGPQPIAGGGILLGGGDQIVFTPGFRIPMDWLR